MQLTDTHIHLYAEEFESDRRKLIEKAIHSGVTRFVMPNIDMDSVSGMMELGEQFPGHCFPMMGLHPCYVNDGYKNQLREIKQTFLNNPEKFVAIGEIGLDYHWDLTFKNEQIAAFTEQVQWAHEFKKPVSIHSRNSTQDIINILRELNLENLSGIFHCFSGDINQADEIMNMGFYLGIGGVVTFKNSSLAELVREIPINYLVLETDGPYLAPTPYRGKRNEPAYLKLVAEKVAELKNIPVSEVARITSATAASIFNL